MAKDRLEEVNAALESQARICETREAAKKATGGSAASHGTPAPPRETSPAGLPPAASVQQDGAVGGRQGRKQKSEWEATSASAAHTSKKVRVDFSSKKKAEALEKQEAHEEEHEDKGGVNEGDDDVNKPCPWCNREVSLLHPEDRAEHPGICPFNPSNAPQLAQTLQRVQQRTLRSVLASEAAAAAAAAAAGLGSGVDESGFDEYDML
jgi:hypothetical protein